MNTSMTSPVQTAGTAVEAKSQLSISRERKRIKGASDSIRNIRSRVGKLADEVSGVKTEDASKIDNSVVESLVGSVSELLCEVDRLFAEVERLET